MARPEIEKLKAKIQKIQSMGSGESNLDSDPEFDAVYEKALKMLDRKMYTVFELLRKLKEKELGTPKIRGAVSRRLIELKFLDDASYARSWIRSRTTVNPKGVHVLRLELRRKRIEPAVIEQALEDEPIDERALALILARKKLKTVQHLSSDKQYERVISLLQRRGFNYGVAKRAWKEIADS